MDGTEQRDPSLESILLELSALRSSQGQIQSQLSALQTSQGQLQSSVNAIATTVNATQALLQQQSLRTDQAQTNISPGLEASNPLDMLHKLQRTIFSGKSQRRIVQLHLFAKKEDSTFEVLEADKDALFDSLLPGDIAAREELLALLQVNPLSTEKSAARQEAWRTQSDHILSLRTCKEDVVQANLTAWIDSEEAAAADTHKETLGGANMFAIRYDKTVESSGKPDVFCLVFPMSFEIKSRIQLKEDAWNGLPVIILGNQEYIALHQSFERVNYAARHNELLKRVVCFASTGHFSWCLIFEREIHNVDGVKILGSSPVDYSSGKYIREKYTLVRMHAEDIVPVWETLVAHVKNASDASYYLHQDLFFPVAGILNQYGIHPAGCKLRFCGKSRTAHIIGVHVGYKNDKKNVKFRLSDERVQLVVKVSSASKGLGIHEIKILQHLHRSLASSENKKYNPTAYVVATYVPPNLSPTETTETTQTANATQRKRTADKMEEESHKAVEVAAGFTDLVCCYELFRTKQEVMQGCIPNDTELHHDPQILVEKNKNGPARNHKVEWYRPNVPASWRDDFCAILMFFGESPAQSQFKDDRGNFIKPLGQVLGKIHQANVLHTDLRPSNWRLFSNLPGRGKFFPLIIDFDHAVFVHPSEEEHQIPTSEGARRDMMLSILQMGKNYYPNGILPWSKQQDLKMIDVMINDTYRYIERLEEVQVDLTEEFTAVDNDD